MYFKDGKYDGYWKWDFPNGVGKFILSDGSYLSGTFRNGLIHGFGKANFANGDSYVGMFDGGKLHGHGLYHD